MNNRYNNDYNHRPMNNDYNRSMNKTRYPPAPPNMVVKKDFYTGYEVRNDYSRADVDAYLAGEGITMRGNNVPAPFLSFNDYPWSHSILSGFRGLGHEKPTPIQAQGWPIALSGRDMVGVAQTGSGKTLSYILPAFMHIEANLEQRQSYGPMALVLAPTRELAQQIQEVADRFRNRFATVCVFGGAAKGGQIGQIRRNRPQLVIATPGRLIDLLTQELLTVQNISYLVLDEADRMLDMGFEPQIRKIIQQISCQDRQTLMWSATWPKEVRTLAEDFLKQYVQINVGALQLHANHNITQVVEVCDDREKKVRLDAILRDAYKENKQDKIIIFAETKRKVDQLTQEMRQDGWPAMCIHGDKSQNERDWVLREFKCGRSPILIATDVAARGLDVDDIKCVINYDYPNSSEDYVHRIGRTGRKNKKGTAYTFFTRANSKQAHELVDVLKEANQAINPKLLEMARYGGGGGGSSKYRRYGTAPRNSNFGMKRNFNSAFNGGGNGHGPRSTGGWSNGGSAGGGGAGGESRPPKQTRFNDW